MNNQKSKSIPIEIAYYIAGFADGEKGFNLSFRKRDNLLLGWQTKTVSNISQKERTVLALIKHHLGCGTIRSRKDNVWVYQVDNIKGIKEIVIPFFNRFGFLSERKRKDFARFKRIVEVKKERTLTCNGLESVLQLLTQVEIQNISKYNLCEIKERGSLFWKRNKKEIERLNTLFRILRDYTPNIVSSGYYDDIVRSLLKSKEKTDLLYLFLLIMVSSF